MIKQIYRSFRHLFTSYGWVSLALAGLWIFFLRHALDTTTSFALFQDNEFFLAPVLSSMSETLRNGEWPLRMDTALGGLPLYNFTQLTPFYPLYLIALPLFESPAAAIASMHWLILLHLFIMLCNTYLFLRVLGASILAALTGAALFTFSANNLNYASWLNIVTPYAWFPLFLAGVVGLCKAPHEKKYAAMTLVGIVLLTLASPSQPFIHSIFTALVFFFAYAWNQYRGKQQASLFAVAVQLAVLGVLAFMLVAPALLPAAFEFRNMIRWIGAFPPVMGNDRIPFAAFQVDQLTPVQLGGALFKIGGNAVGQHFTGPVTVALAVLGVVYSKRSWIVHALLFIALYSLLSAAGSNLGFAYINYHIPLLNKIREPGRFLVLFQFAVCALAGLGLDAVKQLTSSASGKFLNLRYFKQSTGILIAVSLLMLFLLKQSLAITAPPMVSLLLLAGLVLLTGVAIRFEVARLAAVTPALWSISALAILSFTVAWQPAPVTASDYNTSHLASLDTALARVATLDTAHDYRLIFEGDIDKQQAAMLASFHGIRTLNAYFNPAPRQQFEELYNHAPRADNYLRILGAKFLICLKCTDNAHQGYQLRERVAGYELYEAPTALPQLYAARSISGTFNGLDDFIAGAANTPLNNGFLFVQASRYDSLTASRSHDEGDTGCKLLATERSAVHVDATLECQYGGFLVLDRYFETNWKVTIDGRTAELLKVNGNQMATMVPAGFHQVRFHYLPSLVKYLLLLSCIGLILSIMYFASGTSRLYSYLLPSKYLPRVQ